VNWFMVAVGVLQAGAWVYGLAQGDWRIGTMNLLVAGANIVLAGARA